MADDVHLTIDQGATWAIGFPIFDEDGAKVDLSTYTGRSQVRPTARSSQVLFAWSTSPTPAQGLMELELGLVVLSVAPAQSDPWTWRTGVFDLELLDAEGHIWRPIRGTVWVDRQITR